MPEHLRVVGPKLSLSVELSLSQNSGCVSGSRAAAYDGAIIAACGGNGGWMPKVSTKHVQRRIAELDSVAQPKRSSVLKRVLAFFILAIIAVAALFSANRTSSDFLRLTLKQGSAESNRQLSDAEARAK